MDQRQSNGQVLLYHQLFEKVLTSSDVGKLSRLVIPKKHAVAFFPQLQKIDFRGNEDDEDEDDVAVEAINLTFVDKNLKPWMFRYCYWKTCKSYVFTKEWYRFVKEKDLKVDDSVIFYMCQYRGWFKEGPVFYMIDIQPKQGQGDHADVGRNLGLQFDRFGGMSNVEGRRDEENRGRDPYLFPNPPVIYRTDWDALAGVPSIPARSMDDHAYVGRNRGLQFDHFGDMSNVQGRKDEENWGEKDPLLFPSPPIVYQSGWDALAHVPSIPARSMDDQSDWVTGEVPNPNKGDIKLFGVKIN